MNELAEYGLHIEHSEAEDREPIDFEIRDDDDELYATVWGSHPTDDIQIDCEHDIVEYDDDETVGECAICGATCMWHKELTDGGYVSRVPHEWTPADEIGGAVGEYLKELKERF